MKQIHNLLKLHFQAIWYCRYFLLRHLFIRSERKSYKTQNTLWPSRCRLARFYAGGKMSFFFRVLIHLSRVGKQIIVGASKIFIWPLCTRHRSFGKHLNRPNKRQGKYNTQYSAICRGIVFSGYLSDIAFIWICSCRLDLVCVCVCVTLFHVLVRRSRSSFSGEYTEIFSINAWKSYWVLFYRNVKVSLSYYFFDFNLIPTLGNAARC